MVTRFVPQALSDSNLKSESIARAATASGSVTVFPADAGLMIHTYYNPEVVVVVVVVVTDGFAATWDCQSHGLPGSRCPSHCSGSGTEWHASAPVECPRFASPSLRLPLGGVTVWVQSASG